MMEEAFEIQTLDQLRAFSHPLRYRVVNLLHLKPMTGAQLARLLKVPRQRLHYHIKILREAGLIVPVEDIESQGAVEIYYQAVARNFTSHLLVNAETEQEGEVVSQDLRSQNLHSLSLTFIEQVKADLNQPGALRKISRLSTPFQHGVLLTPEQAREAHERFQEVKRDLLQMTEENLVSEAGENCLGIHYTLLVTPWSTGEEE